MEGYKPKNIEKKITPEERDDYVVLAMEWSSAMVAGDKERARQLKEKLIFVENKLNMTHDEIINYKPI